MSSDDRSTTLAAQASENARTQIELSHSSWDATQTNLNTMIGQIAALGNAKLVDFFINNAATKNSVPMTGESLEKALREMLSGTSGESKITIPSPNPAPLPQPTTASMPSRLGAVLLAAIVGAAVVGMIWTTTNALNPEQKQGAEQENYRYNYLQSRGAHLPPENGNDG